MKDKAFWKSLDGNETEGADIVFNSLPIILKTVADNSKHGGGEFIVERVKVLKPGFGYNAKTGKIGSNLVEDGVLDSAKVLRVALENSISAASMILLINCTVTDDITEDSKNSGQPMMPGM